MQTLLTELSSPDGGGGGVRALLSSPELTTPSTSRKRRGMGGGSAGGGGGGGAVGDRYCVEVEAYQISGTLRLGLSVLEEGGRQKSHQASIFMDSEDVKAAGTEGGTWRQGAGGGGAVGGQTCPRVTGQDPVSDAENR